MLTVKARAPFNARAETVAELPLFRGAYRSRRCIIPASCFYEWRKDDDGLKQPMAIACADRKPLAFAGIWESWTDPTSGEVTRTFAILTTIANAFMATIHDRMPVILDSADQQQWLAETREDVYRLLRPSPEGVLRAWPVSTLVNNIRNNGANLLIPMHSEASVSGSNPA